MDCSDAKALCVGRIPIGGTIAAVLDGSAQVANDRDGVLIRPLRAVAYTPNGSLRLEGGRGEDLRTRH
jgi:hypothetical protein